jgi:SAM-dependent methyltransferase
MALAHNYYRWIMREFRPHLGNVVCELGAGIGTFSSLLLEEDIHRLILVEPAHNLLACLRDRFTVDGRVQVVSEEVEVCADRLRGAQVDTIVSVNVLEHLKDDSRTLATIGKVLPPDGKLLLFVPALPWLFGSLDEAFGHRRRYRKVELEKKVTEAGFRILDLKFMNFPGLVSWFVAGHILRSRTISPWMVRFYDRWIVPFVAVVETCVTAPVGPSLILIAQLT